MRLPRRLIVAAVISIATLAAPARAGAPATDGRNVMQVDAVISPARAGSLTHPRAISLRLSRSYRAVGGGAGEQYYRQIVQVPDMVVADRGRGIPQCRFSRFGLLGERGCPKGSRVGSGSAVFDGRAVGLPEEERVRLHLYNAVSDSEPRSARRPGPIMLAVVDSDKVDGYIIVSVPFLHCCTFFSVDGGLRVAPIMPLTDLELRIRRIVGRKGVPYLAAPTSCRGSWRVMFRTTFLPSPVRTLSAFDDVPCRRR